MTPLGDTLLALALDRPGHLTGGARLVCVDGPAGSGKTTAAGLLVDAATARGLRTAVVHMDDLYPGWSGLARLHETTVPLVRALERSGRAAYRRYDWGLGAYAEEHVVEAGDLVVLEGVGSAGPAEGAYDDVVTLRVVVTAPREERLRRGLARDGEELRGHWLRWLDDEAAHLAAARTLQRADVLVDGVSGAVRSPRDA